MTSLAGECCWENISGDSEKMAASGTLSDMFLLKNSNLDVKISSVKLRI